MMHTAHQWCYAAINYTSVLIKRPFISKAIYDGKMISVEQYPIGLRVLEQHFQLFCTIHDDFSEMKGHGY